MFSSLLRNIPFTRFYSLSSSSITLYCYIITLLIISFILALEAAATTPLPPEYESFDTKITPSSSILPSPSSSSKILSTTDLFGDRITDREIIIHGFRGDDQQYQRFRIDSSLLLRSTLVIFNCTFITIDFSKTSTISLQDSTSVTIRASTFSYFALTAIVMLRTDASVVITENYLEDPRIINSPLMMNETSLVTDMDQLADLVGLDDDAAQLNQFEIYSRVNFRYEDKYSGDWNAFHVTKNEFRVAMKVGVRSDVEVPALWFQGSRLDTLNKIVVEENFFNVSGTAHVIKFYAVRFRETAIVSLSKNNFVISNVTRSVIFVCFPHVFRVEKILIDENTVVESSDSTSLLDNGINLLSCYSKSHFAPGELYTWEFIEVVSMSRNNITLNGVDAIRFTGTQLDRASSIGSFLLDENYIYYRTVAEGNRIAPTVENTINGKRDATGKAIGLPTERNFDGIQFFYNGTFELMRLISVSHNTVLNGICTRAITISGFHSGKSWENNSIIPNLLKNIGEIRADNNTVTFVNTSGAECEFNYAVKIQLRRLEFCQTFSVSNNVLRNLHGVAITAIDIESERGIEFMGSGVFIENNIVEMFAVEAHESVKAAANEAIHIKLQHTKNILLTENNGGGIILRNNSVLVNGTRSFTTNGIVLYFKENYDYPNVTVMSNQITIRGGRAQDIPGSHAGIFIFIVRGKTARLGSIVVLNNNISVLDPVKCPGAGCSGIQISTSILDHAHLFRYSGNTILIDTRSAFVYDQNNQKPSDYFRLFITSGFDIALADPDAASFDVDLSNLLDIKAKFYLDGEMRFQNVQTFEISNNDITARVPMIFYTFAMTNGGQLSINNTILKNNRINITRELNTEATIAIINAKDIAVDTDGFIAGMGAMLSVQSYFAQIFYRHPDYPLPIAVDVVLKQSYETVLDRVLVQENDVWISGRFVSLVQFTNAKLQSSEPSKRFPEVVLRNNRIWKCDQEGLDEKFKVDASGFSRMLSRPTTAAQFFAHTCVLFASLGGTGDQINVTIQDHHQEKQKQTSSSSAGAALAIISGETGKMTAVQDQQQQDLTQQLSVKRVIVTAENVSGTFNCDSYFLLAAAAAEQQHFLSSDSDPEFERLPASCFLMGTVEGKPEHKQDIRFRIVKSQNLIMNLSSSSTSTSTTISGNNNNNNNNKQEQSLYISPFLIEGERCGVDLMNSTIRVQNANDGEDSSSVQHHQKTNLTIATFRKVASVGVLNLIGSSLQFSKNLVSSSSLERRSLISITLDNNNPSSSSPAFLSINILMFNISSSSTSSNHPQTINQDSLDMITVVGGKSTKIQNSLVGISGASDCIHFNGEHFDPSREDFIQDDEDEIKKLTVLKLPTFSFFPPSPSVMRNMIADSSKKILSSNPVSISVEQQEEQEQQRFNFNPCPRTKTQSLSRSNSKIPECASSFRLLLTSPSSPKSFITSDLLGELMPLKWSLVTQSGFDTPAPLASGKRIVPASSSSSSSSSNEAFTIFKHQDELETPRSVLSIVKPYSTDFEESVLAPAEERATLSGSGLTKNEVIFDSEDTTQKDLIMFVPGGAGDDQDLTLTNSEYAGVRLVTSSSSSSSSSSSHTSSSNNIYELSLSPTLLGFSLYIPPELNPRKIHKFYFLLSKKRMLSCRTVDEDDEKNKNNQWFITSMTLRPRFSIIDASTQAAAELAGSLSGALTMPVDGALVAATITQANGVLDVFMCSSSKVDTPLGFLESPFGMSIGKSRGKYLRGAVVGNVLIIFIFAAVLIGVASMKYLFLNNNNNNDNNNTRATSKTTKTKSTTKSSHRNNDDDDNNNQDSKKNERRKKKKRVKKKQQQEQQQQEFKSFYEVLGAVTFPSSLLIFVSALTQGTISSSIGLLFIVHEDSRRRSLSSSSSSSSQQDFDKQEFIFNLTTDNTGSSSSSSSSSSSEPSNALTLFIAALGFIVYIFFALLIAYIVFVQLRKLSSSSQVQFKRTMIDERARLPALDVDFTEKIIGVVVATKNNSSSSSCLECAATISALRNKNTNKKKSKNQNKSSSESSTVGDGSSPSSSSSSTSSLFTNRRTISHRTTWMEMIRNFILRHLFFVGGVWFLQNKNNNNKTSNRQDRFFINRYARFFAKNHDAAVWFPLLSLIVGFSVGLVAGIQKYGESITCAQSLMFILAIVMALSASAVWITRPNLRSTANAYAMVATTFTFLMCVFGLVGNLSSDPDSSVSQFSMESVLVLLAAIKFFSTIVLFVDVAFLFSLKILPKIRGLKFVWIHFRDHNQTSNHHQKKNLQELEELLLQSDENDRRETTTTSFSVSPLLHIVSEEKDLRKLERKSRKMKREESCWSLSVDEKEESKLKNRKTKTKANQRRRH